VAPPPPDLDALPDRTPLAEIAARYG